MKTRIIPAIITVLAFLALGAGEPVVSEALVRIQTDPATGRAQAFFEKTVTVDGIAYRQPWQEVSWELGAAKSVTVGEKTYTYAEVFAAVQAIAQQERDTPPPVEPDPEPQP